MKTKYLIIGMLLSLASCAVFKKTNKAISSQSSIKQMEMSEFLLKQANKETHIVTYWNDSGFYQIQSIKERVDEAKSKQVSVKETADSKEKYITKESKRLQIWLWVGIAILGLCTIGRLTNSRWQNKKYIASNCHQRSNEKNIWNNNIFR